MRNLWRCFSAALLLLIAPLASAESLSEAEPFVGQPIGSIHFSGNRRTEDEAIKSIILVQPGQTFDPRSLRRDVLSVWKMGFFDDVRIEASDEDGKVSLTFVVKEKPAIRKIFVAGAEEVGLDKINEVLDVKPRTIIDMAKVRRNEEKIRDLYVEKGYYLAEVASIVKPNGEQVDVTFKIDEHAKVEVREVHFIGNAHVSGDELKAVMQTQEGGFLSFITSSGTFREDAFQTDIQLLTAFYFDRGYIDVKISKPQIELSPDKTWLYITIPLDEGLPYKFGAIDFDGDLIVPKAELMKRLQIHAGESFSSTRLRQEINRLGDLYKNAGYAYANIQPQTPIHPAERLVDLQFSIQQGNKVYFRRINIRGNTKTRDKVIRRELRVYEAELYSQYQLDRSKNLVQSLGFFERVEFSTKAVENAPDKIDLNIEVTERSTGTFQIGAGFSSIENFIGQAQVAQNNLLGHGTRLQLQAQVSSLRQFFTLRYDDRYFLDTRINFGFALYNSLQGLPGYNVTRRGGDITSGYLFGDYVSVFGTYKLEYVDVKQGFTGLSFGGYAPSLSAAPGTITNLFRTGWTSSVTLGVTYDSRNDRTGMSTTRGHFYSVSAEFADPLIASQAVYSKFSAVGRWYKPIWGPIIFRSNLQAGVVFSRSSQGVPLPERFLLGGINSIRGFQLWSLGPQVKVSDTQDPNAFLRPLSVGGNLQLIWNAEIEFPILAAVNIKGVIFFDAGNAYNLEDRYCPSAQSVSDIPAVFNPCNRYPTFTNLRYSAGFGVRWVSPIGPLRFEWGVPINRQVREAPIDFQFTIGNGF